MTEFSSPAYFNGGRLARLIAGAIAAAALGSIAAPALAQDQSLGAGDVYEVNVSAGKSQVLELPANYKDLMIADPKIADVLPLSSRSVYIVGKTMGSTALTIYGPGKTLIAAVNVVVGADTQGLKTRLAEILPGEKDISVRTAGQSIVLSGTVSSPAAAQQVIALADTYVADDKKVVNMLGVEGSQQVMLLGPLRRNGAYRRQGSAAQCPASVGVGHRNQPVFHHHHGRQRCMAPATCSPAPSAASPRGSVPAPAALICCSTPSSRRDHQNARRTHARRHERRHGQLPGRR